jgi:ABC-type transport system involved in multi-copper enzyme maturation permease subunit
MALGVFAALFYVSHKFQQSDVWILVALYFIILQFVIVTALALLFSSFSSPLLSAVFAFSLFVIGSFAEDLRGFAAMTHGIAGWLATAAAYVVPNFSALNIITSVAHGQPVSGTVVLYNTAYSLTYVLMALCGSVLIFERRNLK